MAENPSGDGGSEGSDRGLSRSNPVSLPSPRGGEPESLVSVAQLSASSFAGPLPPPEILKQYEQLHPGFTAELLALWKAESKHREKMEQKQVDAAVEDMRAARSEIRLGQWLGFGIGCVAILTGGVIGVVGAVAGAPVVGSVAGSVIGGGGVVGLVAVFVLGRRQEAKPGAEDEGSPDKEEQPAADPSRTLPAQRSASDREGQADT